MSAGESDGRPWLLLIATGMRAYREYLLASIHTSYRIHLLNTVEPSWERAYVSGFSLVPNLLTPALLEAAKAVAADHDVAGIMTWDEARIVPTAEVAQELSLSGGQPEVMRRCRDKHASRLALEAAGVPQPTSVLTSDVEEALVAADQIGYPVVLKPRAAAASYGVVLAGDREQLRSHFPFTETAKVPDAPHYEKSVLVEEYLDADEVSIDSVVQAGRVTPVFVARKLTGFPPYFEEVGHVVSQCDPLLRDARMLKTLSDTHAALGFADGWTHSEFRLTSSGPKVIEVNGRLGGDLIPYLGMRASGIDPGLVAAAVACGRQPAIRPDRQLVGAVRFFYADRDDTLIEGIDFDRAALPAAIDSAVTLVTPGTTVSPPPKGLLSGRIAFATAVAATADECTCALEGARSALLVVTSLGSVSAQS